MPDSNTSFLHPNRIAPDVMRQLQRGYRTVHGDIMTIDDLAIMTLGEAKAYLAAADQADVTEALAEQDARKPAPRKQRRLRLSNRYILPTAAVAHGR